MREKNQVLLSVNLSVGYRNKPQVLRDFNLEIRRGEILGLVGHSGSGKSTLALAVLGLLGRNAEITGSIVFEGKELGELNESEMRRLRGASLGLVLQSPLTALNPALRIRTQLREAWRAHAHGSREECDAAIGASLASVSLPCDDEFQCRRPSQLSLGQAQRVLIAMAIIHRPALLIADEATSALDIITQSEILALFAQLNRSTGTAILYISHDLPAVAGVCHRVAILHQGAIVELDTPERIFHTPQHPYTRKLIAALPSNSAATRPQSAGAAAAGR
jgi:ABC-type glutathione transport system ATPase component